MENSERFTSAMSQLGSSDVIDHDVAATLQEYACAMYGLRNLSYVNEARLHFFRKLYAPKQQTDPLEKIKSSDPCCLPPCQKALQQKLLRTNYVAYIWKNAREANPVEFGPVGHGWKIDTDSDRLTMIWFEGQPAPTNIAIADSDLDEDTDDDENDFQDGSSFFR